VSGVPWSEMRRVAVIVVALAFLLVAPPAGAQRIPLWPGVSFESGVQFTPHGPVAISILTGSRPGGTTTLAPALPDGLLTGRETVTGMERRLSREATVAGVNGDYFTFADGRPSGVLLRNGQLDHQPSGDRSSLGIMADGTLDVRRVAFLGLWRGTGAAHPLQQVNEAPGPNQVALFTPVAGARTPMSTGAVVATLFPFPAAAPDVDLEAPVVDLKRAASVPIPIGGAVLVARGTAAAALEAEAAGSPVTVQLRFRPEWPGIVHALGGGPQIVRDRAPVFRANEAFTTAQLAPRSPRTGVGQLEDGRVILVTVDGRQPGYSVGMTNFELAQTMVRLGAVTAMALDGGGSTTMAFDGRLLNRTPTSPRPVSNALLFMYTGVYLPLPAPVVSPNGDGEADEGDFRVKLVRPSTVIVSLVAPDGSTAYTATETREPGSFTVPFPPPSPPSPPPVAPARIAAPVAPPDPGDLPEGRWRLTVDATDDLGQASRMTRAFSVNTTLGFLATGKPRLFLPPGGRPFRISWRQGREARVLVTIESRSGTVVRTLARRRYEPGRVTLIWNGLARDGRRVTGGVYQARVVARNSVGSTELVRRFAVQRTAGVRTR
jgi:Phosphodiester glycosidase/FlgD Ig-like domain